MGGVAAMVAAISFGLFMLALALVMIKLARAVSIANHMLDDIRREAIPAMSRVQTAMDHVNTGLELVAGVADNALKIARSVNALGDALHRWVSSPLVKVLGVGAAASRVLGGRRSEETGEAGEESVTEIAQNPADQEGAG